MLTLDGDQVDCKKQQNRPENDTETPVQLFPNIHAPTFLSQRFLKWRLASHWAESKRNSTVPDDSCAADSKRHFLTASSAAFANTGCPPTSFAFLTRPLLLTVIMTFTTPVRFIRFASSGYTGATLLFTFRVISSCPQASGAVVAHHTPISNRHTANARFKLGDTVLPRNLCACVLCSCKDR